jgi:hypothetical protein
MLTFLKEAAAKIANPPPWPEFSPEVRDIASIQIDTGEQGEARIGRTNRTYCTEHGLLNPRSAHGSRSVSRATPAAARPYRFQSSSQ